MYILKFLPVNDMVNDMNVKQPSEVEVIIWKNLINGAEIPPEIKEAAAQMSLK